MNQSDTDETAATLRQGLDAWKFPYTDDQIAKLLLFRDILLDWNANRMNLTRIVEPEAVAIQHFLDSISLLKYCDIAIGSRVLDVGTGAGFPGIVLKLLRPDIKLTLLEATAKKLTFCREVCEQLNLTGVKYVHGRAESNPAPAPKYSFETVTVRAVADLSLLIEWCTPYLTPTKSQLLAMKGSKADEELQNAEPMLEYFGFFAKVIKVDLPKTDYQHHIIRCTPRSR